MHRSEQNKEKRGKRQEKKKGSCLFLLTQRDQEKTKREKLLLGLSIIQVGLNDL